MQAAEQEGVALEMRTSVPNVRIKQENSEGEEVMKPRVYVGGGVKITNSINLLRYRQGRFGIHFEHEVTPNPRFDLKTVKIADMDYEYANSRFGVAGNGGIVAANKIVAMLELQLKEILESGILTENNGDNDGAEEAYKKWQSLSSMKGAFLEAIKNEEAGIERERENAINGNESMGDWGVNNVAKNLILERSDAVDYIPVGEREPRLNSFQVKALSHSPRFSYSAGRFPGKEEDVQGEDGFIWTPASDYKVEKKDEEPTFYREAIRESAMFKALTDPNRVECYTEDSAEIFCRKIVISYPDEAKRRGLLVPDTIIETEAELEAA